MLVRLADQNTLTALSQIILCARLLLNSSNTLNILGFYLGYSAQLPNYKLQKSKCILLCVSENYFTICTSWLIITLTYEFDLFVT